MNIFSQPETTGQNSTETGLRNSSRVFLTSRPCSSKEETKRQCSRWRSITDIWEVLSTKVHLLLCSARNQWSSTAPEIASRWETSLKLLTSCAKWPSHQQLFSARQSEIGLFYNCKPCLKTLASTSALLSSQWSSPLNLQMTFMTWKSTTRVAS